ncbi:unnamed protein product [Withania somnifera]
MSSHGLVSSALFLCVGVLYDRHKTRLVRYYGGSVSTMPNLSTIFFSSTLANMSSPGTSSFIGEFLILVGAFQRNSLVATLAALGMILGAAYSLWLYNRAVSGNLKPDFLHKFSDPNGREVSIFIPFLVGGRGATMHGTSRPCLRGTVELATHECCRVGRANNSKAFAGAAIAYGYSNGRAPAERKVRITSAEPAKRAAGAAGKCLARRPKISLVLDKYVEIFVGPIPYHATHGDLSIDRSEGPPLNKFLKVRLLPASTEEVYFVPPGGHIDRNPER